MKRNLWILAACLVAAAGCATSTPAFNQRVEKGRQAEHQEVLYSYLHQHFYADANFGPVAAKLQDCIRAPGASKDHFTLVADITKQGKVANIDVNPRTNTAECFAAALGKMKKLPPPPTSGKDSLPIFIEMTIID